MSSDAKTEAFEVHYDGLRDEQVLIPAFGPVKPHPGVRPGET